MVSTKRAAPRGNIDRQFNLLWFGQAVSQFGDYLPYVSLPLFVSYLADGTLSLSVVYSLETVPTVIVGVFGGVLIDRLRLKATMIWTDLIRAAAFAYLAVITSGLPPEGSGEGLLGVFTVAFVAGTFASFFNGALYSAVPRLADPDRLADANGRLAASQGLANVLGPAAAGVLVAAFGFWPTFAINSATFVVSATTLIFVRGIERRAGDDDLSSESLRILDGIRHVWAEKRIRFATLGAAGAHLILGFFEATLVLIADDIGATTDQQKGFIYATFGAGALLGSLVVPRITRIIGLGRTLVIGLIGTGLLILAFVNLRYGVAGLAVLFVSMIAFQSINISFVTIRQVFTPANRLGRVITASRAVAWSTLPIGALVGATLSERIGFERIYRSMPAFLLLVGALLIPTILWRDTFAAPR